MCNDKKSEIYLCRTCYKPSKGLKSLKDFTKCCIGGEQRKKSYAQLLSEIANINVIDGCNKELPEYICEVCIRKLKMAHAFVQQAQDVNTRLIKTILKCKDEHKESDFQREDEAYAQSCLGIKMEPVELIQQNLSNEHLVVEIVPEEMDVDGSTDAVEQCQTQNVEEQNKDVHEILRDLTTRLKRIEKNQSILSHGQAAIVDNQQDIAEKLLRLEANQTVSKSEIMDQFKHHELAAQTLEEFANQERVIDKVANLFPLKSVEEVLEVEKKLEDPDFSQTLITYLLKLKGVSEDVGSVIRSVITDDLLESYNWDGRWEKNSLGKLLLFNTTLRDVFQQQGILDYEKSIRKAIERSHHRVQQRKYIKKTK